MKTEVQKANYNAILTLRLAIVLNGMKVTPTPEVMTGLSFVVGLAGLDRATLDNPKEAQWNLYDFEPEIECPIHAVTCPGWLIHGADSLIEGPLKMGEIDPTDWTNGLRVTHAQVMAFAPPLGQEEGRALLDWFLERTNATPPETLNAIRAAIATKAKAIAEGFRCEPDDEPSAQVVVINLKA